MRNIQYKIEFFSIFIVAPILIAVFIPIKTVFIFLFSLTAISIGLLHITKDFSWKNDLINTNFNGNSILGILSVTAFFSVTFLYYTDEDKLMFLVKDNPLTLILICLFYPILSAIPQELIYRVLFFKRYKYCLPENKHVLIIFNAAIFSLAHLLYWSWLVLGITFVGGLIFAYSYQRSSFSEAAILHSVSGIVVIITGMSHYFYAGNINKPDIIQFILNFFYGLKQKT